MKSKTLVASLILAMMMFWAIPSTAQQNAVPKTIAESVGSGLQYAEAEFLSVAQAMPGEKYSFIPNTRGGNFEGVRSFAEQVKHVACANITFFNEVEGKTPPADCEKGGPAKARTKAELLQYLHESFDYGNRVLENYQRKECA